LHSVELIGGGTRIPKLQSMITEILNDQKNIVGTHINGDESMALGGAFFAANSSKKFKVKGINLYDGFNFDVRLVLRNLEEDIK
jgi:hypoxia up-regulated 1